LNNSKIDKISQEIGEMEAKPRELCFVHNLAFFVKVYATTIFIQKIMIIILKSYKYFFIIIFLALKRERKKIKKHLHYHYIFLGSFIIVPRIIYLLIAFI